MSKLDMTRFAAARLMAAEIQPFLAVALYALTPRPAPGLGTMGVDARWRLSVDPAVLVDWTVPEIAGVLLHEVGHVVRDHRGRGESCFVMTTEHGLWNIACDAEINDDLRHDGVQLPEHPVYPETIEAPPDRAAEYYFHLLRTGRARVPEHQTGCRAPIFDADEPDPLSVGVLGEDAGLSEGEAQLVRHQVAIAVTQMAGLQPGSVGGGWTRWAEAVLRPRLDWRTLLRSTIRGDVAAVAGAVDYSYRRPSRRRVKGVVMPSMQRPTPAVAIVIDTSGSVDDEMLTTAWSEVHGCVQALGIRRDMLSVYAVDTAVHRLRPPYSLTGALTGGGGTDLGIGIDAAMRRRPRPHLVVVMTDGFTPWPAVAPNCRVVVVVLERDGGFDPPDSPNWATEVRVPVTATSVPVGRRRSGTR